MSYCSQFDLQPRLLCQLFDAFVGCFSFGSEIWGFGNSNAIEKARLNFF